MNKVLLCLVLSSVISLPSRAALKVADKAADFSAPASLAGKELNFSLKDALKKGPVVVYFYPSAYTKGCDLEAQPLRKKKKSSMPPAPQSLAFRQIACAFKYVCGRPGILCGQVSGGVG